VSGLLLAGHGAAELLDELALLTGLKDLDIEKSSP
jgi:hypothetical protein